MICVVRRPLWRPTRGGLAESRTTVDDVRDFEAMQAIVGGYVERIGVWPGVCLLVNEDGAALELEQHLVGGRVIHGAAIVVGEAPPEFRGLTPAEVERAQRWLA